VSDAAASIISKHMKMTMMLLLMLVVMLVVMLLHRRMV
jgi:hypothetical protein